ncbi:hypothetical protein K438DRAFT_1974572 [Mycena galopus ATCC 62051]|nr:hypothetical protein K438DRAFT_1974572 [Mycena galopus ATCC 62051]
MDPGYPQELIDSFINCLTDPGDFLRCSLVAHAWLPRSQSHIFRTVTLGVGVQDGFAHGLVDIPPLGDRFDNFTHFATLLQHLPHLATYFQELVLGLPPPQAEITANTEVLSATRWQMIEDSVVQFLSGEPPVCPSVRLSGSSPSHRPTSSSDPSSGLVRPSDLARPSGFRSCVPAYAFVRNVILRSSGLRPLPFLRTPSPSVPLRPVALTGTCYAIKLETTANHSGHVLLASTYKNLA